MKKIFALLTTFLLIFAIFTSCSNKEVEEETSTVETSISEVETVR